jgi:hypothetical protein
MLGELVVAYLRSSVVVKRVQPVSPCSGNVPPVQLQAPFLRVELRVCHPVS